jgi:hypothetical protein
VQGCSVIVGFHHNSQVAPAHRQYSSIDTEVTVYFLLALAFAAPGAQKDQRALHTFQLGVSNMWTGHWLQSTLTLITRIQKGCRICDQARFAARRWVGT